MREVGLKTFRSKARRIPPPAAAGETVVITDRGEPILQIKAVPKVPDRYKDHPVLARGIRQG